MAENDPVGLLQKNIFHWFLDIFFTTKSLKLDNNKII